MDLCSVLKCLAEGIVDWDEVRAYGRCFRYRIEQHEVVARSQVAGGSHRHARRPQLMGIRFALVAYDILLAGHAKGWRAAPYLLRLCPSRSGGGLPALWGWDAGVPQRPPRPAGEPRL